MSFALLRRQSVLVCNASTLCGDHDSSLTTYMACVYLWFDNNHSDPIKASAANFVIHACHLGWELFYDTVMQAP